MSNDYKILIFVSKLSVMLAFVSVIALLVSVLLTIFARKSFAGNIYLVGFFAITSLWSVVIYAIFYSGSDTFAALMHGHFQPYLYLPGPFLYLYARSVIRDNARLDWWDILHFIPMIVMLIGIIPYYFVSLEDKIALIQSMDSDYIMVRTNINFLVPQAIVILIRPMFVFVYSLFALILLLRNKNNLIKNPTVKTNHSQRFGVWLTIQVSLVLLFSILFAVISYQQFLFDHPGHLWSDVYRLTTVIQTMYLIMCVSLFFIPEVLYGLPKDKTMESKENLKLQDQEFVEQIADKGLLLFTDEYIARIHQHIDDAIKDNIFLQADFNKSQLSHLTHIPEHHLTYYFNNILNTKFTDWRNDLRIEYAKNMLKTGIAKLHTMESIANMCGYNNQSTFFASFKKVTGITPGEFLKLSEV